MSSFPSVDVLLLVLLAAGAAASTTPDVDFFRECPPDRCSPGGPEIRYPFRLNTSSALCGAPGLVLHCSGDNTILELPSSGSHNVTGIDYASGEVMIDAGDSWSRCSSGRLPFINLTNPVFGASSCNMFTVVNCSVEIPTNEEFTGPIRCLGSAGRFVYGADPFMGMDRLPAACDVVSTGVIHPDILPPTYPFCGGGLWLRWEGFDGSLLCMDCDENGGFCGFSRREKKAVCYPPPVRHKPVMLITGATSAGVVVIAVALVFLYVIRKSSQAKETHLRVEKFLKTYKTSTPTRYSYRDIKKITKRFSHTLGRGGFGSVYQGEMPNGIPVAVKMLERSMHDGEDFINEVATTGRIHHFIVVRLLGFCSEGPRRALVYEFMPNGSLEKFIFSKDGKRRQLWSLEKLEEIIVGIARGIAYLHQGCSERILHFDIKPHNILLDHNFNPKVSDFGLAKLCSKDQSIVSVTAARGTMGYIAPEMYSRNFGTISYKSDVYSFGMLLIEMISGRKTVEPNLHTSSQVYLPEQIYDALVQGEELASRIEMEGKEEIARKLAIVALWCIQWNPNDRPSMTRVVQMLTGSLQSLQIPSTPFVSFSNR